jgi:hypothetical protein
MRLICKRCSTELSPELSVANIEQRNETAGEDFLRRGTVMQEDRSHFHERGNAYIAHIDDVTRVHLTNDGKRLAGCCGLDGMDGPNLQCDKCGAYVATKKDDCWMPHRVVFDPATTEAIAGTSVSR